MKKLFFIFIATAFFLSCNQPDEETKNEDENSVETENVNVNIDTEKLKGKIINWRGGSFFKGISADKGHIVIQYVNDFNDLKSTYPIITITEEDYKEKMNKPGQIDKILAEIPVKTFVKSPQANSVTVILPFEGTNYTVKVTKKDLEEISGKSFDEIKENYIDNFANKFVLDEAGRNEFVKKFVTKQ